MNTLNLHLGCGTVYLDGWINVDIEQEGYSYLTKDRPDLMEVNKTTLDNYYKYPYDAPFDERGGDFVVADVYWDMTQVPYPWDAESVDKILCVGTLEHFYRWEAERMLAEWLRLLKPDGEVLVDVPDMIASLAMIKSANKIEEVEYAIKLIYGSQKNTFSLHKWGYTFWTLQHLMRHVGYKKVFLVDLIEHEYPMFTVRGIK